MEEGAKAYREGGCDGIVAVGETIVIIAGGFDLSVGSLVTA